MKDKQQGAALVIVMALLSGALLIGVSGMNSALIDERLAGNYRAVALAQMNAERAASEASADQNFDGQAYWGINANADGSELLAWKAAVKSQRYEELKENYPKGMVKEGICDSGEDSYSRCLYFPVFLGGSEHYVVAMGSVEDEAGNTIAESEPIFLRYDYGGVGLSPIIKDFLDDLKGLGNGITTFEEADFSSSGNDKAEGWEELIANVDSNDFFKEDEVFLSFIEELKNSPKINYFSSLDSKELSKYNNSIVVVEEDFSWNGSNYFEGVLILLGKGESKKNDPGFSYNGGGSGSFKGSIVHIPYEIGDEGVSFLQPKISVKGGNGNLEFDATVIDSLKDDSSGNGGGTSPSKKWQWE